MLQEEANAAGEWMNGIIDGELGDKDMQSFKEKGVDVYILPKEERDRWIEKMLPYKEEQLKKFGEFGQKVKQIADDVNAKHPYSERGLY